MRYSNLQGPGRKPTKKIEPIEPESDPEEPTVPDWDEPTSDDH